MPASCCGAFAHLRKFWNSGARPGLFLASRNSCIVRTLVHSSFLSLGTLLSGTHDVLCEVNTLDRFGEAVACSVAFLPDCLLICTFSSSSALWEKHRRCTHIGDLFFRTPVEDFARNQCATVDKLSITQYRIVAGCVSAQLAADMHLQQDTNLQHFLT